MPLLKLDLARLEQLFKGGSSKYLAVFLIASCFSSKKPEMSLHFPDVQINIRDVLWDIEVLYVRVGHAAEAQPVVKGSRFVPKTELRLRFVVHVGAQSKTA